MENPAQTARDILVRNNEFLQSKFGESGPKPISSIDDMVSLGLAADNKTLTPEGRRYKALVDKGFINKDGTMTTTGKAFTSNKDEIIDPTSWLDAGMTDEALDVEKANMLAIRKNSGIDAEPEKSIGESFKEFGQGLASIGKGSIELAAEAFDPKDESKIPEAIDSFIETAVTSGAKLTRSIDRERLKAAAAMGNIPKEEADKLNVLRDYKLALIEKSQKDMDAVETASLVGLGENILRAQDEARADYNARLGPEEGPKKYDEDINNVRAAASLPGDLPGIAVGLATAGLGAGIGIIRNAKAANQARKGISIIERGKELNSVKTALVADAAKLSDEAAVVSSQLDDAVRIGATEKATELSNKLNGLTSQLAPLQSRIGVVDDGIKNVSDAANKIEIGIDTMKTAGDATRAVASGATRGMANGAEFIGEKAAGLNKFLRRIEGNFMRGRLPWLIHTALAIPLGKVYGSYVATRISLMAAPPILRKMSNFGRVMSEEMLERTSSTPFFRRVAANESIGGLGRAVATLGDYSTPIAKGVASMAKGTAQALPTTLSYNAINSQGLDENSLKYAARDAFIFGSLGRLIGGKKDMNQVHSDQMFNYRNKLDPEQAATFDGLKDRDFRYALSGIDASYPGVFKWELKTSGDNKFDPASSKAIVNLNDKVGFLKEVAMHEAGHMIQHVWQKDGTIVSRMLGDGTQPGLVRNTDGTLDPEFKAWSDEYNKLRIDNDMAPADLNELAIEYYTDQGVQTLLDDTLKGNLYKESRKTPLRRSVEGSFRTLFNATPIVKNLHFKMGGATDASGRMVMGTGLLANGFRELPEVKSMIRQMYRETAGKPKLGQRTKIVDVASENPKHYEANSVIDRVNKELVDRGDKLQPGVLIPDKNGNGEGILTDAHLKALEESGAIDNGEFGKSLLLQTEMDNPQKHGVLLVNKPVKQGRSEQFGGLAEGYVVPTKWLLRKGRLYVEAMDLRQLDKNVDRAVKNKIAKELGLSRKQIFEDIEKSVELQNKGASSDSYYQNVDPKKWQRRKNFINSVIGLQTKRQLDINPIMRKVSPDPVTGVYRTFAFDRLQSAIQTTGDVVIPFGQNSYYSIRDNLMPQSPRVNRNGELVPYKLEAFHGSSQKNISQFKGPTYLVKDPKRIKIKE